VTFSLAPEDNFDFHVGLNQVVYEFGQRGLQVKLAQSGVEAAQIGMEQIRSSLAYQTAQSFYTVLLLAQEVAALDEQLADLSEHLAAIQKKEQTGSATIYDVLSTEVRVAAMRNQRIEAENSFKRQLIALKALVGVEPGQPLTLSGSLEPAPIAGAPQELLSQAFTQRAELAQANETVKSAELSVKLAKRGGLPSLSAYAQAGFKTGLLPSVNQLTFNWNAGAAVNVPIFAGLQRVKSIEQAQAKLAAAQSALDSERQTVTTQVLQAYQDRQASQDQAGNSLVQLSQAEQMLKVAKVQYDLGTVTNLDYLDSQSSLEQARLERLTALYHEVIADYVLKAAIGERIWSGK